ncbi:hypothetical protein H1R20_g8805, partial [Candolleomyces eurysporus]
MIDVSTARKLAREWTQQIVIPAHQSKAAQTLLDNTTITMHTWTYPGPPASFLDYPWQCNWADVEMAFGNLTPDNPCPLQETPVLERIIVFKGNLMVSRDSPGPTKTLPDISLHKAKKDPARDYWGNDGSLQAFMEGKGPLAAGDTGLNEGLDLFFGGAAIDEILSEGDYDAVAFKILGQVKASYSSQLKFSCLIAPPFLFRPTCFIQSPESSEANAFLSLNRIPSGNINYDDLETSARDPEAWENFFCELIWFTLCVWVKVVEDAQRAMEQHDMWNEWKDHIERSLRVDRNEILVARE